MTSPSCSYEGAAENGGCNGAVSGSCWGEDQTLIAGGSGVRCPRLSGADGQSHYCPGHTPHQCPRCRRHGPGPGLGEEGHKGEYQYQIVKSQTLSLPEIEF